MDNKKQPGYANQQPRDWPEAGIRLHGGAQHVTQHRTEAGGVNCYRDRNKGRGNRKVDEHRGVSRSLLDRSFLKIFDRVGDRSKTADLFNVLVDSLRTKPIAHRGTRFDNL